MSAQPKPIVLVDDETAYAEFLTQMLRENLDCPIHVFSHPVEAIKALRKLDPAVVVTDYNMPEIDGLELIRRAGSTLPHTSFVLISGHNLSAEADKMARLRALKLYLPKPFGWRKLLDEVLRVWPADTPAPKLRATVSSV